MKIFYLLNEVFFAIKKHRVYFFAPMLIVLALVSILVFVLGPHAILAFIYAGI